MTLRFFLVFIFSLFFGIQSYAQTKTHEVKSQETKYGISRLYGISIEELESANPGY